jgi:hypothetical protein
MGVYGLYGTIRRNLPGKIRFTKPNEMAIQNNREEKGRHNTYVAERLTVSRLRRLTGNEFFVRFGRRLVAARGGIGQGTCSGSRCGRRTCSPSVWRSGSGRCGDTPPEGTAGPTVPRWRYAGHRQATLSAGALLFLEGLGWDAVCPKKAITTTQDHLPGPAFGSYRTPERMPPKIPLGRRPTLRARTPRPRPFGRVTRGAGASAGFHTNDAASCASRSGLFVFLRRFGRRSTRQESTSSS